MESIMSDTRMTQNKTAVASKMIISHISRRAINRPRKENLHLLFAFVLIRILLEIVPSDIITATFVIKRA